jgi:adenylate cyclase
MSDTPPSDDWVLPPDEQLLGLGEPKYTSLEVVEKTGLDLETAKRLWRAMGFVVVPETETYFTDADIAVLKRLVEFMEAGFADLDLILGITRTMSQSIARIAEAEAEAIRERLASSPDLARRILDTRGATANEAFESLEEFLVYVWRRHLVGAFQREDLLGLEGPTVTMSVGFADLVAFTRLSQQLSETELAEIIERFESLAQEAATEVGARIVKTIGDEVMFVADEPRTPAAMALRLLESCADEELIDLRIGVATGEVTAHHGDYFGPSVNLANRAARAANPGTVLISEKLGEALAEDADFEVKPIPRRRLKGIGSTQLYVLRRGAAKS